jgi:hypothetical protein
MVLFLKPKESVMIKIGSIVQIGKATFEVIAMQPYRHLITIKHPKEKTYLEVNPQLVTEVLR